MTTFIAEYKDILLFFGILIFGLPVLLPAVYASMHGFLEPKLVFTAALSAILFSDALWYALGSILREKIFDGVPFLGRGKRALEPILRFLRKHPFRSVFLARFTYGTKIVTNAVSGVERIPFGKFFAACAGSAVVWVGTLYALSYAASSIDAVRSTVRGFSVGLLALVLLVVGSGVLIRRYEEIHGSRE